MRHARPLVTVCALLTALAAPAYAAPGDAVVPAHRTKDGHWVPANVPPASGGTHLAHRPGRGKIVHRQSQASQNQQLLPPLLVEAQPIRR
jgi:hypothetical protein